MTQNVIIAALKTIGYTIKDVARIAPSKDPLKGKIYLNGGKGCLFLEGWTTEVRRKRQKDGKYSFFRMELEEPLYRVRLNDLRWWPVEGLE